MRKKLLVMIIAFIGMCSVIYTQSNDLFAASEKTYNAGGAIDGRINISPTDLTLTGNKGLQKGDKVLLGAVNPKDNSNLSWMLMGKEVIGNTSNNTSSVNTKGNWIALSTQSIGNGAMMQETTPGSNIPDTSSFIRTTIGGTTYAYQPYKNDGKNEVAKLMAKLNDSWSTKDNRIIIDRDISRLNVEKAKAEAGGYYWVTHNFQDLLTAEALANEFGKKAYLYELYEIYANEYFTPHPIYDGFNYTIRGKELSFSEEYTLRTTYYSSDIYDYSNITYRISSNGSFSGCTRNDGLYKYPIRPAITLNFNDVVFATSMGSSSGVGTVTERNLSPTYTDLYNDTSSFKDLKLRIHNSDMDATLNDISYESSNNITNIVKGETLKIDATANSVNNSVLSVLLFKDGKFAYYLPLESVKSSGTYAFDTTGIEVGKYDVSVVNEVYDEASTEAADSSLISNTKKLEIVSPISNLTFSPTSNLKYNSNVNISDKIGTISSQNGAGTPVYTLVADSIQTVDVDKFEIGNDGISIQVKGNALDAGTYKFKIQAQDANGHPDTPVEIGAIITVAKGDITSVVFDDPSQTKKSITDAQTSWNETATSTPSTGVKVKYSIDSGNLNLLSIDPDTGAITMKTTTGFGKVVIKATADDDTSTGKDNVNPKSITKDVVIHQDVEGSFTPDSASSNVTDPTFSASDPNVKGNGIIGSISGTQGTPDNLVSGAVTYTYTLKSEEDYNFFVLIGSTLKVKSGVDLGVDSYTVKIAVADKYGSKDISVNINVGMAAAEKLDFYDEKNAVITSKGLSVPYGSKNISVLAKGANSSNANPITYSIEDASTNIITVQPSSGVLTINGVGTTKVKAIKAGGSGQAEASQTMSVTITKGEQADFKFVDFAGSDVQLLTKVNGSYEEYKDPNTDKLVPYVKDSTFQLHTNGANGDVTYELKTGSESDVVGVDADGTIRIKNASNKSKLNRVSVTATSIDTSGTYSDKVIEIVVNIDQGEQTLSFVDQPVMIPHGNNVSVMPTFNAMDIGSDETILDTDVYLDQSTITYTNGTANVQVDSNDNVSLKSSYTGLVGVDGTITAIKNGNRNYKQVKATGTFHIMDPSESDFAISYPNEVFYGDSFTFTPRGDDSGSTNVVYQITANQSAIADYNTTTKKASAKQVGEASFTIKRTADGEVEKEKTVKVSVKAKAIEIVTNEKERYVGETNPSLTYDDFTDQLISWDGATDVIASSDIKLSTSAILTSPKGSYQIIGNSGELNKKYTNYVFTFTAANFIVKQDVIEKQFYELRVDNEAQMLYDGSWTNSDVLFVSKHSDYTSVSNDKSLWEVNQLTISKEGSTTFDFWMKKDSGALSESIQETIKIDKQAPVLEKIEATSSNNSLEDILHKFTLGYFFKPGTMFTIYTDDTNEAIEVSKTKSVDYTIQRSENGSFVDIKDEQGTKTASVSNEKATIKISDKSGLFQICATPIDTAGNLGKQECREVKIAHPGVNESSDDDELPDLNIDVNDDGIPDLNITKNPGDKKPWVNIDSDGDGKADMNLDRDRDGVPYLNTGVIMDWKCDKKVDIDKDGKPDYKTSTTVKGINNLDTDDDKVPDLNIDKNLDGLPELNINTDGKFDKPTIEIDGNGDGKPDINLDEKKDGKPDKNIVEIKEWKPEHDVMEDGNILYDTMMIENPEGKKELEDKDIIVEYPNGNFLPNYALKVDVITSQIDQSMKDKVIEKANGQVIKEVYEVELTKDGVQVQPDGRLKIKIPLPKNLINPHLIIELADGSFRKISVEIEDDYMLYESDFLGKVIVVGDSDVVSLPDEDRVPNTGGTAQTEPELEPQPTVKGNYVSNVGANTGDSTSMIMLFVCISSSFIAIALLKKRRSESEHS